MELSDPATPAIADAPNRRKSGRAIQKPVLYQQDPNLSAVSNGSGKRKRTIPAEVDTDVDPMGEETSSDENESEPDEEELKEKRRRAPKAKNAQRKPAAKKPKTATVGTTKLVMRPATNGVKRPSKPRKRSATKNTADGEGSGLYGEAPTPLSRKSTC